VKRFLILALLLVPSAWGQGISVFGTALQTVQTSGAIPQHTVPVSNALIYACAEASPVIPPVNSVCSPANASLYSDIALSHAVANPFTADANGNYQFYTSAGSYVITEYNSVLFTARSYVVTLAGAANVTLGGNNTFTGSNTFTSIITGSITGNAGTATTATTATSATTAGSAATATTATNLSGPGSISGVFSGNPTFSGNPIFSGSPTLGGGTLNGTYGGNPAFSGNVTMTAGQNNIVTASFLNSVTGVFTNTQNNFYAQAIVNSANCTAMAGAVNGGANFNTDAWTGCLNVPNTATVEEANSGDFLIENNSPNTAAVGVRGGGWCNANSTLCWGGNAIAVSSSGLTGTTLTGYEVDVSPFNSGDIGQGILINGTFGAQSSNMRALNIAKPQGAGGYQWTAGLYCTTGAILSGNCLQLPPVATGNTKTSMYINFASTNSSGTTLFGNMVQDANGNLLLQPGSGGNLKSGSGILPACVAVGSLPSAASSAGVTYCVNDSTAIAAEGQTCAGSSSNTALAFSNGSSWKCF